MIRLLTLSITIYTLACSSTYPNRSPQGETFPKVRGVALDEQKWELPGDVAGQVVILLIGYKKESQFDIDRWLIGLDQTGTKATILEIPAIQGFVLRMIKNRINTGMRRGIPRSIWKAVITVYEDGEKLQRYTGNQNPLNSRVLLLGKDGQIHFFYDQGFSVEALNKLRSSLFKLASTNH